MAFENTDSVRLISRLTEQCLQVPQVRPHCEHPVGERPQKKIVIRATAQGSYEREDNDVMNMLLQGSLF